MPTKWPKSSVVRVLAWSAMGPGFKSRSGLNCAFSSPSFDIWWPMWGTVLGLRAAKGISSVQAWFPADFGENLFKTVETVTGLPYGVIYIAGSARTVCDGSWV